MNTAQNLPSNVPFWNARHKQSHRHTYCSGMKNLTAIECRYDRMLPWIIQHTPETTPNYVYLVSEDGLSAINLGTLITVQTDTVDAIGYIYYDSNLDINQSTPVVQYSWEDVWDVFGSTTWAEFVCDGGYYYIEVAVGEGSVYVSELLHIVDFPEFASDTEQDSDNAHTRVRFEVLADCTVAGVPTLSLNNSLIFFADARAAEPEYEYDNSVAKAGNNEELILWTKVIKKYVVRFYALETVCDFFAMLPLYEAANLINGVNFCDQYGINTRIYNIEVKPTWGEEGNSCVALLELKFQRDFAEHSGCC